MTAQNYIDEVKLRIDRNSVAMDLSDPMILSYVNRAREEVQRMSLPLYPERYGKIQDITLTDTEDPYFKIEGSYSGIDIGLIQADLPNDTIDVHMVFLRYILDGVTYRNEARKMEKKEVYQSNMGAWSSGTASEPLYSVDKTGNTYRLILAGLKNKVSLFTEATGITAEVWYTAALPSIENSTVADLTLADIEVSIPVELEEAVVLNAILLCLENINAEVAKEVVNQEIIYMNKTINNRYQTKLAQESQLLPSKEL
jgi:hypothetical protein